MKASELRALFAERRFRPSRARGQNFLVGPTVDRLVDACDLRPHDFAVEIGCGPGQLTERIARRVENVVAIEIDPDLAEIARLRLAHLPNVAVVCGDGAVIAADGPCVVVSNLPYADVQRLLLAVFGNPHVRFATLTVQREFYEKLAGRPARLPAGGRSGGPYGAWSVVAQSLGTLKKLFNVPRGAFVPMPAVDSVAFRWVRDVEPPRDLAACLRVLETLFRERRRRVEKVCRENFGRVPGHLQAALLDRRVQEIEPTLLMALALALA